MSRLAIELVTVRAAEETPRRGAGGARAGPTSTTKGKSMA